MKPAQPTNGDRISDKGTGSSEIPMLRRSVTCAISASAGNPADLHAV